MDAPDRSLRDLAEKALYAGVGAVVLTGSRVEELVREMSRRGEMTTDESRQLVDEMVDRWSTDAARVGERASLSLGTILRELGVVTRREHEELELRLAQLEHRLRLLEGSPPKAPDRVDVAPTTEIPIEPTPPPAP